MTLTSPALSVRGLTKSFGETTAVTGLDFDVAKCEVVALMGPSGCGKTTTLRLVAGLEQPDGGRISIAGRECTRMAPERRGVGFVFQDYALFPHLDVEGNVAFGLNGIAGPKKNDRVGEVLELVGLTGESKRFPRELSGGQQQRVALARAIAPRPSLLLLDEPFSNLDAELRRRVRHEVLSIVRSTGAAAVWVTHDRDEGLIVSDRIVLMHEGALRQTGSPSQLWRTPADAWVAGFIGQGDLLPGVVRGGAVRTALGGLRSKGLAEGARVKVLVRPGDVTIGGAGTQGTVVRRHFSGEDNVYCIELEEGTLLHSRQPEAVEIPKGTRVAVRLSAEELPVFPG